MPCSNKKERTLDVIANSEDEFNLWFWGVQILVQYPPHMFAPVQPQAEFLRKPMSQVRTTQKL